MSSPGEAQPAKRRPGRPRKLDQTVDSNDLPVADPVADPEDERIGQTVEDVRAQFISYQDGSEYRIKGGVITERVR